MKNSILFIATFLLFLSCSTSKESKEDETERLKIEKTSLIISTHNRFTDQAIQDYTAYIKDFGGDPNNYAPTNYNSIRLLLASHSQVHNLEKALTIDVYNELNPLINTYIEKGASLVEIGEKIYKHTIQDNYQNIDNNKIGVEGHKPLLLAFKDFLEIDSLLLDKLTELDKVREAKYIENLKKEGNTLMYLVEMSLKVSDKMTKECLAVEHENLGAKKLELANKNVQEILIEFTKYKSSNKDEFIDKELSGFYESFEFYAESSQKMYERIRDKIPYTNFELNRIYDDNGEIVSGSPQQLVEYYNRLITSYNYLNGN